MNPNKEMTIEVSTLTRLQEQNQAMREALDDLRIFSESVRDEWQNANPGKEYNPLRLALIDKARAALKED